MNHFENMFNHLHVKYLIVDDQLVEEKVGDDEINVLFKKLMFDSDGRFIWKIEAVFRE